MLTPRYFPEAATDAALIATAVLFCLVTGANDGGAVLATGLKLPILRVVTALSVLTAAVVAIPLLFGAGVAETFAAGLVSFGDGDTATAAVLIGVLTALAVTLTLTYTGRPTSLTLATVGGLTGAGLGAGLPVSGGRVALVLALGMAAPLAGGLLAAWVVRGLRRLPPGGPLSRVHLAGFAVQCAAYAANDAQKMLAVLAIALGTTAGDLPLWATFLAGALFAAGALYGLPRAGRTLGGQLLAVRPVHAVTSEVSASGAVLCSSFLGVPVSMTQSVAGGLIGAGVVSGAGRVRWEAAMRLAMAWLLTLPGSVVIAAMGALVLR
ncbi:inorganic phosphate transporter [Actinomadura hibisca]|uniref:inorganic phosphate transporter n=1 Tax=Actinomadura hibisca TaxID=68565 RepID=UPI001FE224AF|nr:inorganic phosphate transporter [Actinomadura hibisca]